MPEAEWGQAESRLSQSLRPCVLVGAETAEPRELQQEAPVCAMHQIFAPLVLPVDGRPSLLEGEEVAPPRPAREVVRGRQQRPRDVGHPAGEAGGGGRASEQQILEGGEGPARFAPEAAVRVARHGAGCVAVTGEQHDALRRDAA